MLHHGSDLQAWKWQKRRRDIWHQRKLWPAPHRCSNFKVLEDRVTIMSQTVNEKALSSLPGLAHPHVQGHSPPGTHPLLLMQTAHWQQPGDAQVAGIMERRGAAVDCEAGRCYIAPAGLRPSLIPASQPPVQLLKAPRFGAALLDVLMPLRSPKKIPDPCRGGQTVRMWPEDRGLRVPSQGTPLRGGGSSRCR